MGKGKRMKRFNNFDQVKDRYLPKLSEKESNLVHNSTQNHGNKIALNILNGIKKDIKKIKI